MSHIRTSERRAFLLVFVGLFLFVFLFFGAQAPLESMLDSERCSPDSATLLGTGVRLDLETAASKKARLTAESFSLCAQEGEVELAFPPHMVITYETISLKAGGPSLFRSKEQELIVKEGIDGALVEMRSQKGSMTSKSARFQFADKMAGLLFMEGIGDVRLLLGDAAIPIVATALRGSFDFKKEELLLEGSIETPVTVMEPKRGILLKAVRITGKKNLAGEFQFQGEGLVDIELSSEEFFKQYGALKGRFEEEK